MREREKKEEKKKKEFKSKLNEQNKTRSVPVVSTSR